MSSTRRAKAIHGSGASALTPASYIAPASPDYSTTITSMIAQLKVKNDIIKQERKRHGQAETILLRMIAQLERQIEDLRNLYFSGLKIQTAPLTGETK